MIAALTSCQDDNEWKPTWALPVVKEQTIRIGDFMGDDDVADINAKVKEEWSNYVNERFGLSDTSDVDSVAYKVLTSVASDDTTYVTFKNGAPVLNDSTVALIKENLTGGDDVDKKIQQINDFLQAYYTAQQAPAQNSTSSSKARPRAANSASSKGSYGGDTAVNNLLDAMIHPTDVFITAANVLSTMGGEYLDSINSQIDSALQKANMVDSVDIDLAEYVGENASITALEISLDIKNSLPFKVTLNVNFTDADGDSISNIVSVSDSISSIATILKKLGEKDENELNTIIKKAKRVKFSATCKRDSIITEEILRTLSQKTISFSLRVRVQAPMNKFDF